MADPPPCYLLEKIPAELRNRIYDLVLAPNDEENEAGEVNLCKAKSPPKDLIMTCRQIHSEAANMYKADYRRYWRSTRFNVARSGLLKYADSLKALSEDGLEQVTQLRIERRYYWVSDHYFIPEGRGWRRESYPGHDVFVLPCISKAHVDRDTYVSTQNFHTYEEFMAMSARN